MRVYPAVARYMQLDWARALLAQPLPYMKNWTAFTSF